MNPYGELSLKQAYQLKADYDQRHYDALDYLAAVDAERQRVANHIKDLLEQERQNGV